MFVSHFTEHTVATQHESRKDGNGTDSDAGANRAPVLICSTLIGTGVGVGAGIVYMTLAAHVKGSEWLLFALLGCVLGAVCGVIVDALKANAPLTQQSDGTKVQIDWRSPLIWIASVFGLIASTCWLAWALLVTVIAEKQEISPEIAMGIALGGLISFMLSVVFGYAAKQND